MVRSMYKLGIVVLVPLATAWFPVTIVLVAVVKVKNVLHAMCDGFLVFSGDCPVSFDHSAGRCCKSEIYRSTS